MQTNLLFHLVRFCFRGFFCCWQENPKENCKIEIYKNCFHCFFCSHFLREESQYGVVWVYQHYWILVKYIHIYFSIYIFCIGIYSRKFSEYFIVDFANLFFCTERNNIQKVTLMNERIGIINITYTVLLFTLNNVTYTPPVFACN